MDMKLAGMLALIVLLCVSLWISSCGKKSTTIKTDVQAIPEVQDLSDETFNNPIECKIYFENWTSTEYELQKCYEKSDKLYNECD